MSERKVILYIAMSLDGYIADQNDGLGFLSKVEAAGEDYGYSTFVQTVDTIIWGRKTYDKVLSFGIDFPYSDKKCYVWSHSRTGQDDNVTYYSGALKDLIVGLKQLQGKDIYCDGGGEVVSEMLEHQLIDRIIVSVIPHLLGGGVRLFRDGRSEQNLKLVNSIAYPSGLVQLWYDALPDQE